MRWGLLVIVALFAAQALAAFTCPDDQKPIGGTVTKFAVPEEAVNATKTLFPEGKPPIGATYNKDVKIAFTSAATMSITFMWEGAGYRNVFGYFLYDAATQSIKQNETIFQDVTWLGTDSPPGCMETGTTVNVSRSFKAGDIVGFWIVADGYPSRSGKNTWTSIHNTTNVNNVDGKRHTVWAQLPEFNNIVLIGFEDLYNLGDKDYNDVMFYLTINGTYNDGDIPVYNNGTLETCEPSEIIEYNEVNCTQYALLTARNPLACQAYISVEENWVLAPDNEASKDAIVSFGPDAGCIVVKSGNGYDYTRTQCAWNAIKSSNFSGVSKTCYTVGCEMSILVIGQTVTGCTGQANAVCNPAVNKDIINKVPSQFIAGVPINPTSYGLFLNKKAGSAATQPLDFAITIPEKTKVEIQLLLDLNGVSAGDLSTFKSDLKAIHNNLRADGYLPSIGLSTIDPYGTMTIRPITPESSTLVLQGDVVTAPANSPNPTSKIWSNFATLASSPAAGWSKASAYRFIVIISTKGQNGDGLSSALSAHVNKMVAPIVLATDLSTYSLSGFKFASRYRMTSTWASTWLTRSTVELSTLSQTVHFTPVNDIHTTSGFVKTLPGDVSKPTANTLLNTSVVIQYPTVSTAGVTFPYTLKILVWGYDVISVKIVINHDPVILPPFSFTSAWNETTAFTLEASDEDSNTLSVTWGSVVPSSAGSLFKNNKGQLLSGTTSTDLGGSFSPNGWASGPINVTGTVTDGCSSVPFTLTFIANPKPNNPPTSNGIVYPTLEDTPVLAPIPDLLDQEDPASSLVALITVVKGQGTFYTDSTLATKLEANMMLSTVAARSSIWYVPPPNTASVGSVPLGTFDFRAIDTAGAFSPSYTVGVRVTPVNDPPVFTGEQVITIDEDTRAEIGLRDYIEDIDTDSSLIKVIIGKNVQRGTLYECVSTETGCDLTEITTVPYELDLEGNPSGRVIFVPLPNENGDNYATFNLVADDRTDQVVYTITINVRPVNDPPVITPFFSLLPVWNEMDEDTELVLSWNVTDIDSPVESLTVDSRAFPQTFAGKLYQYVPNGNGYTRGDELSGSGLIPRVSPGVWSVIVVPNANIYDNSFLRLRLTAYDDYQAPSVPVNAPVRVLPINDPPVIAATEQTLTRTDSMQITLGFISVTDIDAGRKNVDVSFTVQDTSVGYFGFDALTSREQRSNPCKLNADNTSVLCTDDLASLNEKWFKLIIYYPGTSGSQVITVFADDLGHTDKWDRPLNDTKLVVVNIGEDTGLLTDPGTDNTLTIAVAVSVAGAVGAVALVLFLIRDKLAGQTDAYFESLTEPLSTGGVNPVYQQAGSSGQNPTYVPRV